jgi:cell division protein FtsB
MKEKVRNISQQVWRFKYVWTLLLFALILGVLDTNSLLRRSEIRAHNEALRAEIAEYNERFEADRKELRALRNDPDVVEEVARMRLFMKTPNEDVYIIEQPRQNAEQ